MMENKTENTITFWKGKAIEDYSKEELVEIVKELGRLYINEMEKKYKVTAWKNIK